MLSLSVMDNKMPEIFYTLQGEGVSQGVPAVFIRLTGCNLYCQWCDTPYTWRFSDTHPHDWNQVYNPSDEVVKMALSDVMVNIMKYPTSANLVFTGGEPLLQDKFLADLFKDLSHRWIEIETNGTIIPVQCGTYVSQYNVSPKLENSGNERSKRHNHEALKFFAQSYKSWFKFVVVNHTDLDEVYELVNEFKMPHDRVILMPEGISAKQLEQKRLWLSEICKDKGFRFSTRLQIYLYGSKRGT